MTSSTTRTSSSVSRHSYGIRGYWDKVSVFGDLQHYCEAQYRSVDALCRVNRQYLENLTREALEGDAEADPEPPEPDSPVQIQRGDAADHPGSSVAGCVPGCVAARAVGHGLSRSTAMEGRSSGSGTHETCHLSSNVIGNLRSRPRYRRSAWKRLGIQSLVVSINRP